MGSFSNYRAVFVSIQSDKKGVIQVGFEETKTCSKCGKKWDIHKIRIPMRDKDSLECDCGEKLLSWNGGVMYTSKPSEKK